MMGKRLKLAVWKQMAIIRGSNCRGLARSLRVVRQIGSIRLRKGVKWEISGKTRWGKRDE